MTENHCITCGRLVSVPAQPLHEEHCGHKFGAASFITRWVIDILDNESLAELEAKLSSPITREDIEAYKAMLEANGWTNIPSYQEAVEALN